jgi:hypothetical protein
METAETPFQQNSPSVLASNVPSMGSSQFGRIAIGDLSMMHCGNCNTQMTSALTTLDWTTVVNECVIGAL